MIDKDREDTIKHRTIVRRRRAALVDADDDDTGGIVGVYASHNEVDTSHYFIFFKLYFIVTSYAK